jgi:hypothetical protein
MLALRTGSTDAAGRSFRTMNAFAVFVVNDHLNTLLEEAAKRRAVQGDKPGLSARIGSAAARLRSAFTTPVDAADPVLPKLDGYPYRG